MRIALGSLLYTAFGVRPVLAGAGVCFLVTAALECFIRLPKMERVRGQSLGEILREDLLGSARFLARERREVLDMLLFVALANLFLAGAVIVGMPYLIRRELGLSAQFYGAAESAAGLAAALGSIAAGFVVTRLPFRRLYLLVAGLGGLLLLGGGGMLLPVGPVGRYGVLTLSVCIAQAISCIPAIFVLTAIQQKTPEHMTGKVMACIGTLTMCAQPLGQLAYGFWFDMSPGWLVLAASGIAVCFLGLFSKKLFADW